MAREWLKERNKWNKAVIHLSGGVVRAPDLLRGKTRVQSPELSKLKLVWSLTNAWVLFMCIFEIYRYTKGCHARILVYLCVLLPYKPIYNIFCQIHQSLIKVMRYFWPWTYSFYKSENKCLHSFDDFATLCGQLNGQTDTLAHRDALDVSHNLFLARKWRKAISPHDRYESRL